MNAPAPVELSYTAIQEMLATWSTFWEITDPKLSPWPDDPDGGELRLVAALSALVDAAAAADDQGIGTLSTASVRRELSRRLTGNGVGQ